MPEQHHRNSDPLANGPDVEASIFLRVLRDLPEALLAETSLAVTSPMGRQRLERSDLAALSDLERAARFFLSGCPEWRGPPDIVTLPLLMEQAGQRLEKPS